MDQDGPPEVLQQVGSDFDYAEFVGEVRLDEFGDVDITYVYKFFDWPGMSDLVLYCHCIVGLIGENIHF